jgi:arylsulfatase A
MTTPNVIMIIVDDLGWADVSYNHANSPVQTPNIDRLAANALIYSDYHTAAAWCMPTRLSILTGKFPFRYNASRFSGPDGSLWATETHTLPKLFKAHGYRCETIGKWHGGITVTDLVNGTVSAGPLECGFDNYQVMASGPNGPPYAILSANHIVGPAATDTQAAHYSPSGHWTYYSPGPKQPGWDFKQTFPKFEGAMLDTVQRYLLAENAPPFFLHFPVTPIHIPIQPTDQFVGSTRVGPAGDFVVELDHFIGELTDLVDRYGQLETTLFGFTVDNGGAATYDDNSEPDSLPGKTGFNPCAGLRAFKGSIYEGGHRVPTFIHWPSVIDAGAIARPVCSPDWYATFAEILGAPLTATDAAAGIAVDSLSLAPDWNKQVQQDVRSALLIESLNLRRCVRVGDWKYILGSGDGGRFDETPSDGTPQLFNIADDQAETTDLAASYPAKVAELSTIMTDLLAGPASVTRGRP